MFEYAAAIAVNHVDCDAHFCFRRGLFVSAGWDGVLLLFVVGLRRSIEERPDEIEKEERYRRGG